MKHLDHTASPTYRSIFVLLVIVSIVIALIVVLAWQPRAVTTPGSDHSTPLYSSKKLERSDRSTPDTVDPITTNSDTASLVVNGRHIEIPRNKELHSREQIGETVTQINIANTEEHSASRSHSSTSIHLHIGKAANKSP